MNENLVNESQDITIGYDCGRFVVSVKVGMGSEDMVTLRERTREAGVILCGTPVVSEGSIFENRFIQPDEAFLTEICERSALPVSVKTRIGLKSDDEYERVLDIYRRMPLAELIVHPRLQTDLYRGTPRLGAYAASLAAAGCPVAYNGDIFSPASMSALVKAHPATRHVMLGRGILTNPALARMIGGGPAASLEDLERFHDELYAAHFDEMGGNAVMRMKEWWFYAKCAFENPQSVHRMVRGVRKPDEYAAAVARIFRQEPLAAEAVFRA